MTTAEILVQVLKEKNMTCATAESCTGGGVGYTITGVSGASAVFWGGVISYDNSVKRDLLGVPEEVLLTKGAVSPECAAAMAEGARRLLKPDLAAVVPRSRLDSFGLAFPRRRASSPKIRYFPVTARLSARRQLSMR